jgi:glycosyltransferase involved in cell wall biosynthesis
MSSPIASICRQTIKDKKLNILCCSTHERYESGLAKTGHNFFALSGPRIKTWNTLFAQIPENYKFLPPTVDNVFYLPLDIEIDLVLSQNKFSQFEVLKPMADKLHVPLVSLEHTGPMPDSWLQQAKDMRGNINVFISKWSRNAWGWGENEAEILHHGIDTDVFCPGNVPERKNAILTVVNGYIRRGPIMGFDIWKRVTSGLEVNPIGDSPGFSMAPSTIEDLVQEYQTSKIFLNTSVISPIPTSLLEAMACGCAVVSTETCAIPDVIVNGVNGFMSNNENHLRLYLEELINNEELAKEIGKNARKTILEKYNMPTFVNKWNDVFNRASQIVYTGVR